MMELGIKTMRTIKDRIHILKISKKLTKKKRRKKKNKKKMMNKKNKNKKMRVMVIRKER